MRLTTSSRATQLVSGRAGLCIQHLASEPVPSAPSCRWQKSLWSLPGPLNLPVLQTEPGAPAPLLWHPLLWHPAGRCRPLQRAPRAPCRPSWAVRASRPDQTRRAEPPADSPQAARHAAQHFPSNWGSHTGELTGDAGTPTGMRKPASTFSKFMKQIEKQSHGREAH